MQISPSRKTTRPELLAPAGSEEALYAAVENGADAVYFGIAGPRAASGRPDGRDEGTGLFNARARAANIPLDKLADTLDFLHRRNLRGYVALNTLAFCTELPVVQTLLRACAEARVDALLVQDFGVARLARALCPELPLHASTQMSLTSAGGLAYAKELGIERVVLPRELFLEQIGLLLRSSDSTASDGPELEVFVHGALCMSFSGQCYASLALGGRSANRGRCAQPCRMTYTLRDGEGREQRRGQLLSPTDLCTLPLLPKLLELGVHALKIEGRLKPPEYVAATTRVYREAIDAVLAGRPFDFQAAEERLALIFSRGFSGGWLAGTPPQTLVPGNVMAHRGMPLGRVVEVRRDAAVVKLTAMVRRGDGVLFENKDEPEHSQGGRVYEIFCRKASVKEAAAGSKVLLTFANDSLDARWMAVGQEVRKTDDPRLEREVRKTLRRSVEDGNDRNVRDGHNARKRIPLCLTVRAAVGESLRLDIVAKIMGTGKPVRLESETPLEEARKHPMTVETLREQFGRLGETRFALETLDAEIHGNPMVPLSVLGQMRRRMVELLDVSVPAQYEEPQSRLPVRWGKTLEMLRAETASVPSAPTISERLTTERVVSLLFRELRYFEDTALLQRCIEAGCRNFYAELPRLGDYARAAECVRNLEGVDVDFVPVVPRILKPGEEKKVRRLADLRPEAVLVRNLGALRVFREREIPCIADFSFNAVNDLAMDQLLQDFFVERVTPGPDLDVDLDNGGGDEFAELLKHVDPERLEWIVLGRRPLFMMEHCLWKANLQQAGQPCEALCRRVPLKLQDRYGAIHTLRSDLFCRNIVENAATIHWTSENLRRLETLCESRRLFFRIEWDERLGFPSPVEAVRAFA